MVILNLGSKPCPFLLPIRPIHPREVWHWLKELVLTLELTSSGAIDTDCWAPTSDFGYDRGWGAMICNCSKFQVILSYAPDTTPWEPLPLGVMAEEKALLVNLVGWGAQSVQNHWLIFPFSPRDQCFLTSFISPATPAELVGTVRKFPYKGTKAVGSNKNTQHLYLKWTANKDPLYSTGNSAQYYVTTLMGKNLKKNRYVFM